MKDVSFKLKNHYTKTFLKHGANSRGVDWGTDNIRATSRQKKMLEIIRDKPKDLRERTFLDVGCGYGALASLLKKLKIKFKYAGVELVEEMIILAKEDHPECDFFVGDFLNLTLPKFDYVVCNGILTQKLSATNTEMNAYAKELINKMFDTCRVGIAFNVMNTHVTFQSENLYYRNPVELIAWCISELSPHVRLDCAYDPWYEYTIFVYKEAA